MSLASALRRASEPSPGHRRLSLGDEEITMRMRLGMVVVALAALTLLLAGERPTWAQRGPIKVALLVPTTGALSANGRDMINGLELYFEEQKYRLAGREIKLIVEDRKSTRLNSSH